jgi:hypothetical protein
MVATMTDSKAKPNFGAPADDGLGKSRARDVHSGKWSCLKVSGYGQMDAHMGSWINREAHEPFRQDLTLPTPKDWK